MEVYVRISKWSFLLVSIICLLSILQACTVQHTKQVVYDSLHKTELIDHHRIERPNHWVLSRQASIYLARPQWLVDKPDAKPLPRAFYELTNHLYFHFKRTFPQTVLASSAGSIRDARLAGVSSGRNILVYPQLMLFKDQLSSWQEVNEELLLDPDKPIGRDRVALQILVYDLNTNRLIDSTNIFSYSGLISIYEHYPQQLFEQGVEDYVYQLSGRHSRF